MERYAKGFRSFGGSLILLELAVFFLPLTECTQDGYTTLRWSQFDHIKALLGGPMPYTGGDAASVTGTQTAVILCCMVLPLVLALAAGIWGIFGSPRQWGSSILIFIILILYIVLGGSVSALWPEAQLTQAYARGIACTAGIAISGCSAVAAILALASTPKKIRRAENKIPQVQEIKQQQAEAKYSVMIAEGQRPEAPAPEVRGDRTPGRPRGVMVGLSGLYAGAEIPMPDGEFIGLGRQNTNHLVFEGQAKVSREHCKIKWDAASGKYIIRDHSSTGSFINGSSDCLPQNLPLNLEPGTILAIGDDTNTFRLE